MALIDRGQNIRWTWQELSGEVDKFAAGLLALGLKPGERIGIWSLNRYEWTVTQFAAARIGLILVTINPSYRVNEFAHAINLVECSALVMATSFKTSNYLNILNELCPEFSDTNNIQQAGQLKLAKIPSLRIVIQLGKTDISGMIKYSDVSINDLHNLKQLNEQYVQKASDTINVQFTSGTTGSPKGVTLSHHNILNNGYLVGRGIALTEKDKVCIPVPLYHCFGMVMGNLACLTNGSTMVYPGEGFDILATLTTVMEELCTALYGVPTMFIAELDHPRFNDFDLSSLRTGIMAGSICPIEIMQKVIDLMNIKDITICYGMTETSPVSFQSTIDDPISRRVSTIGRVHPHLQVKIVDSDNNIVPVNKIGELCTMGYSVMLGYWGQSDETAKAILPPGWMHTGDLAVIDEEGYCTIVGRIKDMIIRGGENIYPREVEDCLYRNPNIQDVQVFAVTDRKYGEEIGAWIKLRENANLTLQDIQDFCRDKISQQKIPRYVSFVDSFPMTVTGKIQKNIMRESIEKELNIK